MLTSCTHLSRVSARSTATVAGAALRCRYFAQSKAVTTEIVRLGVDTASMRTQVAPVGSRTSRSRPPEAIRRTCVEVAIGKVVVASTQELERPFINTVVVGGAGVAARPGATQAKSAWGPKQQSSILQHLPLSTPPPAFAEAPPHTLPSLASPPFLPLTPGYTFHLILSS